MNREQIIRMAKNEYGIYAFTADSLAEFAVIIAAAEREACARVCEDAISSIQVGKNVCINLANIIRARGEK